MQSNIKKLLIATTAGLAGLVLASAGKLNENSLVKNIGISTMGGVAAYMWCKGLKTHLEIDRQYREDINYQI